ncbi:heme o synthase [Pigmentiphaga sp. GD03639]|uniref:Protoheme IX farnesyltransferase n=1 Tax=Pigmentiphaga daeguensis TaxID=414049 RepID=A0ABP3MBC2_9BURK|nr:MULTISPECIES: heme o synthase [unclassified Pigmentiphaga]MDH2236408.1 heme o synthase [Pigmentiphaga sp. GD03639]OVZ63563.1 protoheme IX farnesyltransferase [Pigmentiphaga sp. NML030171]
MESITVSTVSLRLRQYWVLTKPRVSQLAVFCAVIGMFLATPAVPPWQTVIAATIGIWLLAAAAFAINCLIEEQVDARMARTAHRPTARGDIGALQIIAMSGVVGGLGMTVLYTLVNPLTMWLTFATFVGYAIIYTVILKPRTPQNIVIGGLSGAMPPALGWAAVADSVPAEAWLLVLIIFIWTPPHFWALALYRTKDYENAGLPMLPVTHGQKLTRLHILLYSVALFATTLLPYVIRMSGLVYLASAVALGLVFVGYAWKLYRSYSDELARRLFRYSILYLSLLFAALLVDHWL